MPKTRHGGLTIKQRAFVKNMTDSSKNLTQGEAARLAGYSDKSADSIATGLMSKTSIIKALEKKGITDDYLVDNIKRNIDEGVGIKATADTATKNIELVLKLRGDIGKDTESTTNNTQNNYIIELNSLSDEELEARYNRLQEVVASTNSPK